MIERLKRNAPRWPWLVSSYRASRASLRELARSLDVMIYGGPESRRMKRFRDLHRGERCFVIGNGPSLRGRDLSPLAHETTFVANHFYFHPQIEMLNPSYYCASDLSFFEVGVHPEWRERVSLLPPDTVLFLPVELSRHIRKRPLRQRSNIYYLRCDRRRKIWRSGEMSLDASRVLSTGDSVTLDFCLPLAYFMGFSEVYLLGCDTDYGSENDAEHFYDETTPSRSLQYHRDTWYENVTRSYTVASRLFETAGRQIYNATDGGRLEVFPRVSLEDALGRPRGVER